MGIPRIVGDFTPTPCTRCRRLARCPCRQEVTGGGTSESQSGRKLRRAERDLANDDRSETTTRSGRLPRETAYRLRHRWSSGWFGHRILTRGSGACAGHGPHPGDLFGRQVPAAERVAEPESPPGVRGQTARTESSTDGWGDRSGAWVPPGTDADAGRSPRETFPGRSVRGHLRTRVPSTRIHHRRVMGPGGQVASKPRGVEFEQSDEATRGFVPFSARMTQPLLHGQGLSRP